MIIYTINKSKKIEINSALIQKLFKQIQKNLNLYAKQNIVEINFISDKKIKFLNNKYRNKNKVTDVLSFPYNDINKQIKILGEIFISFNVAKKQALLYEHSLDREICFLILHGFLHLCGFDHIKKSDEIKMFSLQKKILTSLTI